MMEEKTGQLYGITSEHLIDVVTSPTFRMNMRAMGSQDDSHDWTFVVRKALIGPDFHVGCLFEGLEPQDSDFDGGEFILFLVRYHPNRGLNPITEFGGSGDLESLSVLREGYRQGGLDVNPIGGIVSYFMEGIRRKKSLLMFQERSPADRKGWGKIDALFYPTDRIITNCMERAGYNANTISLDTNSYTLCESKRRGINKFEFTPRIICD